MKDLYETLEVDRDTPKDKIASAYRRLARKYHPDANGGDPEMTEKFKEVAAAYEVLSDPQKKAQYDMYGSVGSGGPGGKPFTSVFNDFFSNMFTQGPQQARGGAHIKLNCELDLNEVLRGGKKEIKFERAERCSSCNGSGGEEIPCQHCDGKGSKIIHGQAMTVKTTCHACEGTGKTIGTSCGECVDGFTGTKEHTLVFNYPQGVEGGMRFVFKGQGHPAPSADGVNGNVYVLVSIKPHELFERGSHGHILLKVPVSYTQLVLGDEMDVPTLDGKLSFKIPKGTQPNTKFRLKEQGLPAFQGSGALYSHGDQIVEVQLEVPKDLTGRHKEIIEELAKLEGE